VRRLSVLAVLAAALLGLAAVGRGLGTAAQDGTPAAMAGHPIAGTWLGKDVEDTTSPPFQVSFLADGLVIQAEPSAGDHLGVWHPTGPRTFALTIQQASERGIATIRGEGEVAAAGQRFAVAYTVAVAPVGGAGTGQYGPGHIAGRRLAVAPPGTPVGPLSALKAQFAKPGATPGASDLAGWRGGTDVGQRRPSRCRLA